MAKQIKQAVTIAFVVYVAYLTGGKLLPKSLLAVEGAASVALALAVGGAGARAGDRNKNKLLY